MLADAQLSSLVRRILRAEAEVARRAAVNAANLVRDMYVMTTLANSDNEP